MTLRLVVFDVDGTLVDSQGDIVSAMAAAFAAVELPMPDRVTVLSIVGLSLDVAMGVLAPDLPGAARDRMVEAYKQAYMTLRATTGTEVSSPLYPGARDALARLQQMPDVLLGVATGKSKRGLDRLIEGHGLQGVFVTRQVADFHPSKPHPSMLVRALADTGVAAEDAVMIGDTSYDMEMARSAGIYGLGVSWGYHGRERLGQARTVIDDFAALDPALDAIWSVAAHE